jgi:hypothetical protein
MNALKATMILGYCQAQQQAGYWEWNGSEGWEFDEKVVSEDENGSHFFTGMIVGMIIKLLDEGFLLRGTYCSDENYEDKGEFEFEIESLSHLNNLLDDATSGKFLMQ